MFGIGSGEVLVILLLALVLLGPQKLPDVLRAFGKAYAQFRRMTTEVRTTLEREIEKVDEARRIEETKRELFGDDDAKPAAEAASPEGPAAADSASESPSEAKPAVADAGASASHSEIPATASGNEAAPAASGKAQSATERPAETVQEKSHA